MSDDSVLVVGATGSVGRLVVAESLRRGHRTRALVRSESRGRSLPEGAEIVVGDLTDPSTLAGAVDGVAGIVFTQGSHGSAAEAERVDYGAVRNVLQALGARSARIALMTTIGVTRPTPGHDWKRRGERLVRSSGLGYTIVRPGWFDLNEPDQQHLVMLQGDRRWAGDPSDGVISRASIARTLVAGLDSPDATGKTFELLAEHGPAQGDLTPLFAGLAPDRGVDGVLDTDNLPPTTEPDRVIADLARLARLTRRHP